jgi:hypothetical protein
VEILVTSDPYTVIFSQKLKRVLQGDQLATNTLKRIIEKGKSDITNISGYDKHLLNRIFLTFLVENQTYTYEHIFSSISKWLHKKEDDKLISTINGRMAHSEIQLCSVETNLEKIKVDLNTLPIFHFAQPTIICLSLPYPFLDNVICALKNKCFKQPVSILSVDEDFHREGIVILKGQISQYKLNLIPKYFNQIILITINNFKRLAKAGFLLSCRNEQSYIGSSLKSTNFDNVWNKHMNEPTLGEDRFKHIYKFASTWEEFIFTEPCGLSKKSKIYIHDPKAMTSLYEKLNNIDISYITIGLSTFITNCIKDQ